MNSQKITPFLWFDGKAEEAAQFYTSIFKNSNIDSVNPMITKFNLNGQYFIALNGGPQFVFNESISFVIDCEDQEEVDYYWEQLTSNGGQESQCAWLKDKYGVSWQVVPKLLVQLLNDPDREKAGRVMQAMLHMKKINCQLLQDVYDGK